MEEKNGKTMEPFDEAPGDDAHAANKKVSAEVSASRDTWFHLRPGS